ncbi:MAG TPA: asparagine synthase (glutamine-hydrolyzing) [Cyclobacteriaceae bacterium]|nr:asparagine synthase (glutamine-hydrolyzing) [Cyclobacteriaceae bacterium]HMV10934.1 asparagine synthase (glutamine-hydrolyzing) [Cyclobacteriaceae bacterium]HMV89794.1 asparagine synthase (glutamine-hydrolyzing) [Cyclobacteriaceae bacterium]HMX02407.1 asparagine synthase (glutamine-hydrolyzing) [Cyclobacteriaceae bacterium]HMX52150.1 asparagine synthase (glutamine-hydrolyzing) [Cyclobacteriaceae bacterium]
MCGITGIFAFNLVGKFNKVNIAAATMCLEQRGPDNQNIYNDDWVALGHRRLSIIDTSAVAHQPMWDESGRYCIAYNGEVFNYRELRQQLEAKGVTFFSQSDTEVVLKLFMLEKEKCLNKLNGFFALCVYDKEEQTFFVARDRYGVKPLLYLFDEDKFLFASEMKSIMQYGIDKTIDFNSLYSYLQLNYIPAPDTIFKHVKKLLPGHYLTIVNKKLTTGKYYDIPVQEDRKITYDIAKEKLIALLDASVQRRLISDVPLGAFLSGGIDSSVITALAVKHKPDLHTFSIGFKDEKFFDETHYARLVADHFKTEHTVFSLTNDDLYEHVHNILNYLDEPFADSSAINVYILSKQTRKHATVALSGDGADEILAGYNKHAAFYRSFHPGIRESIVQALSPLWNLIPQSRNNTLSNKARQFARFAEGMKLPPKDRYWRWAAFADENVAKKLLTEDSVSKISEQQYADSKAELLKHITGSGSMKEVLLTDAKLLLPNDMLTKVDLMSMANALEVRTPFLDFEVVNFIFSLPEAFKINPAIRKRLLQDAFKDILPAQLYKRPKKGFEVPLLKWFRKEMKSMIVDDLLSKKLIDEQGIFNYAEIQKLKAQLFSSNPGDVHARIWGLVVFQFWWKKYLKP